MAKNKQKIIRAKLKDHKIDKKELKHIFSDIPMEQVEWYRDLLPEFLWIDSLVNLYGELMAAEYYNIILNLLDPYNIDPNKILLGLVSDFSLINISDRLNLTKNNIFIIEEAILKPFSDIISLYPSIPMKWLENKPYSSVINKQEKIKKVESSIGRLFLAKDSHCGFCRALPLNRYFKHNKIQIFSDLKDLIKAIETYPKGDRYRVEAFARNLINAEVMQRISSKGVSSWPRYFWKFNYKLSPCQ